MHSPFRRRAPLPVGTLAFIFVVAACAQTGHSQSAAAEHDDHAVHATSASMSGKIDMSAHMRLTPERTPTAEDSARARAIVVELREGIRKYRDVRAAEADGYRMFAPNIKHQRVYHFTSLRRSFAERNRFDPAQPTSLLYRKNAKGEMELTGAMYVAPKDASLEELDARVPLSIARWHAHTNICVPKLRDRERWKEVKDGQMVFGPAGRIATKEECDAAGGRFHEQIFGWMVHATVYESDEIAVIFGEHSGAEGHGGHSH